MVTRRFLNFGIGAAAFTAMAPSASALIAEPVITATPAFLQNSPASAQSYVVKALQKQSEIAADLYKNPDASLSPSQERAYAAVAAILDTAEKYPHALQDILAENNSRPLPATNFRKALDANASAVSETIIGKLQAVDQFAAAIAQAASHSLFAGNHNPKVREQLVDLTTLSILVTPVAAQLQDGNIQAQIRQTISDGNIKFSNRRTETVEKIVNEADEIGRPIEEHFKYLHNKNAVLVFDTLSEKQANSSMAVPAAMLFKPFCDYMRRTSKRDATPVGSFNI